MKKSPFISKLLALGAVFLFALSTWSAQPGRAAALVVDTTDDDAAVNGNCTLREAIVAANTNAAVDACQAGAAGADTITFSGNGVITLNSGLPGITGAGGPLTIDGGGDITVSGNALYRVFHVYTGGELTLQNLVVSQGYAGAGGGLYNDGGTVTIEQCTFASNTASNEGGGGLRNLGNATISTSVFSNNTANGDYFGGGGILSSAGLLTISGSSFLNNTAGGNGGGGIATNMDYDFLTLVISDTTFSNNQAVGDYGSGGGIFSNGDLTISGSTFGGNQASGLSEGNGGGLFHINSAAAITNSTFSGNAAAGSGGGIYYRDDVGMALANVTISGNSANTNSDDTGDGGGIYVASWSGNPPTLQNSILADNTDSDGQGPDGWGDLVSLDYNMIQDTTGLNISGPTLHNLTAQDPVLGALADNGGPTQTMALMRNSPAIDSADPAVCLAVDQRGEPRADLRCDIGAFELQYADSNVVIKSDLAGGSTYSFGPTWISMTLSAPDTGVITITKLLAYPGGLQSAGEMQATWWISSSLSSGFPVDLSFCYTDAEAAGLDEDSLRAYRWESGAWVLKGGVSNADKNCLTVGATPAFSAWTLATEYPTALTTRRFRAAAAPPAWSGTAVLLALGGLYLGGRMRRRHQWLYAI